MTALTARASLVLLLLIPSCSPGRPPLAPPPDEQRVDEILSRMTLREKIGQLFMVGYRSEAVGCDGGRCDETIATLLEEFRIGAVVLFERKLGSGMHPLEVREELFRLFGRWSLAESAHVTVKEKMGELLAGEEAAPATE